MGRCSKCGVDTGWGNGDRCDKHQNRVHFNKEFRNLNKDQLLEKLEMRGQLEGLPNCLDIGIVDDLNLIKESLKYIIKNKRGG